MAVTILNSITTSDGISYHAISVIGSRSEVVVQAYEPNEAGMLNYLCGTAVSSEKEAIEAVAAIKADDQSHWVYKVVTRAKKESASLSALIQPL